MSNKNLDKQKRTCKVLSDLRNGIFLRQRKIYFIGDFFNVEYTRCFQFSNNDNHRKKFTRVSKPYFGARDALNQNSQSREIDSFPASSSSIEI